MYFIKNLVRIFYASYFFEYCRAVLKYQHFYNSDSFEIRSVGKKGEGLFTLSPYKKGDVIFVSGGRTRFWKAGPKDTFKNPNWYSVNKDIWIVMSYPYVKANHSNYPNMGIDGSRIFVALRDIEMGDELVFDYSITEYEPGWSMGYYENDLYCGEVGPIQSLTRERFERSYPYIPTYLVNLYNQEKSLRAVSYKKIVHTKQLSKTNVSINVDYT